MLRRAFLFSLLIGTTFAFILAGEPGRAAPAKSAVLAAQGSLKPLAENAWDYAKARHLLVRAGFGAPPAEVAKLEALGLRKAVDALVDFGSQPGAKEPLPLRKPAEGDLTRKQANKNDRIDLEHLREVWIKRMVETPRPLEEKLVLFWHGHFATEYRVIRNSRAMFLQNQLFRENAAGNFGKMLHGIVRDPAMLRYLDNYKNVKGQPNENLARELMELFSMGDGNYTEQDIKEAARALTGYSLAGQPKKQKRGSDKFHYATADHDAGQKAIFGLTANWDGDQLVDLILQQPATARFVAQKLFTFFVHESPDEPTVEYLAEVLRSNHYELAPLLKTIFLSEEFYSQRAMGTQIKSPVQLVVGTLRTLGVRQYDAKAAVEITRVMGQELLDPPNVKGWDGGRSWINSNTLFARHNYAVLLTTSQNAGVRGKKLAGNAGVKNSPHLPASMGTHIDWLAFIQEEKLQSSAAIVDYLAKALLVVPLQADKRKELIEFLGQLPPPALRRDRRQDLNGKIGALFVLMMGMPESQLT